MVDLNQNGDSHNSQVFDYFAQNKRMAIMLAILGVLVIIAVVINLGIFSTESMPAGNSEVLTEDELDEKILEDNKIVDVLPGTEREVEWDGEQLTSDPFLGPIELIGTITGGEGENYAILKTENKRLVTGEGDKVFEVWEVKEITADSVLLISADRETKLEF